MLGVATLIIVMSVMNGFRTELLDTILGVNGHVFVHADRPAARRLRRGRQAPPRRAGRQVRHPAGRGPGAGLGAAPATAPARWCAASAAPTSSAIPLVAGNITQRHARRLRQRRAASPSASAWPTISACSSATPSRSISPRRRRRRRSAPRRASRPIRSARSSRSACPSIDASFVFMPLAEAQLYFNTRRRRADVIEIFVDDPDDVDALRDAIEAGAPRPVVLSDWRQRNQTFFYGARGRAQRDVHDPDADRAGRGAQHHLRPDHAGEGQGPRHRHPAHHGRHARRDPAHLPDDRRGDRRRRHDGRPRCSASCSASTSNRSASSSRGSRARCCSTRSSIS